MCVCLGSSLVCLPNATAFLPIQRQSVTLIMSLAGFPLHAASSRVATYPVSTHYCLPTSVTITGVRRVLAKPDRATARQNFIVQILLQVAASPLTGSGHSIRLVADQCVMYSLEPTVPPTACNCNSGSDSLKPHDDTAYGWYDAAE